MRDNFSVLLQYVDILREHGIKSESELNFFINLIDALGHQCKQYLNSDEVRREIP